MSAGPAAAAALAAGYLVCAARAPRGWSRWRTAAWCAGCLALAAALSPLLAAHDPRAHMAQHLLIGMVAPLGLVLGAPVTLVLRVASRPVRRGVARVLHARPVRVLGHPVTALVLSTGGLYVVMLTPLYAATETHPLAHYAVHVHYLAAGYLFAWAVAGPDPAPGRPGMAARAGTLLAAAAAHSFLAKYLYAHAETLPPGTAERDVAAFQDAARIMYYGGDVAEVLLAGALFGAWYVQRARTRTFTWRLTTRLKGSPLVRGTTNRNR